MMLSGFTSIQERNRAAKAEDKLLKGDGVHIGDGNFMGDGILGGQGPQRWRDPRKGRSHKKRLDTGHIAGVVGVILASLAMYTNYLASVNFK